MLEPDEPISSEAQHLECQCGRHSVIESVAILITVETHARFKADLVVRGAKQHSFSWEVKMRNQKSLEEGIAIAESRRIDHRGFRWWALCPWSKQRISVIASYSVQDGDYERKRQVLTIAKMHFRL